MNILISGDSWSQGEWGGDWQSIPSTYQVHHPGINQYLQDAGHWVTNVGAGAIGNLQALDNLKYQLNNNVFDYLIFFFTDPLRDCTQQEIKSGQLFDLVESKTKIFLDCIKEIKYKHVNLKIIMLGGYARFGINDTAIDYAIPSIIELLVPSVIDSSCAISPEWKQYLPTLSVFDNSNNKQQVINFLDQASQKLKIMKQHKDLFYPDGYHPNRHAHRLLTDKILQILTV